MIGYAENGKNYPVELDSSGKMYVNVPWTDTNTTYGVVGANGSTGLVKNGSTVTSASGYTACPIVGGIPYYKDTNTTYANMKAATASAAGKTTANGAVIADDPGAAGEFVWSITISDVPANVTIEELIATLKVTAAGGQIANVTVTQAAGDSTIELDKETINLDVMVLNRRLT